MPQSVGLKLEKDVKDRLKRLGRIRDRSPHWLMRDAIVRYLDQAEQYEKERQEDQERWDQYVLTGEAIAHEDMIAWLHEQTGQSRKRSRKRA